MNDAGLELRAYLGVRADGEVAVVLEAGGNRAFTTAAEAETLGASIMGVAGIARTLEAAAAVVSEAGLPADAVAGLIGDIAERAGAAALLRAGSL